MSFHYRKHLFRQKFIKSPAKKSIKSSLLILKQTQKVNPTWRKKISKDEGIKEKKKSTQKLFSE